MGQIYRIAERTIEIDALHQFIHQHCAAYKVNGVPDFAVKTVQADIDFEREKSEQGDRSAGRPIRHYSDDYLETLAVYRKIAEKMLEYDTMLFHGSAIAVGGRAYLFTARSGVGKSTHTRLWRELLGEKAVMVNDDKPLIRITDTEAIVYGTPWDGKHHLSSNVAVPLKAICILEQAPDNSIRPVTRTDALPMLIQQTYRPAKPAALVKTLSLIDSLSGCVALYRLGCNMDLRAAELSYRTMKEGK